MGTVNLLVICFFEGWCEFLHICIVPVEWK